MPDLVAVRRALVSVSDKAGLLPFVQALVRAGAEIISTGGTAASLKQAGIPVTPIESVTGFPEILDGRVKTLHPKVHGALLAVRDNPGHLRQLQEHAITPIDLVCVNLYPFEQTVSRRDCSREEAIENIDIGGPSMIRSAAKNHASVAVVTSPAQYARVESELARHKGSTSLALREELAADAFALTARYDSAIAGYLAQKPDTLFPPLLTVSLVRAEELRYGENPHQRAALYRRLGRAQADAPSIPAAEQLHGKELSYNNINDAAAALDLVLALRRLNSEDCGACVVKHTNPCGAAIAPSARDAVHLAIAGDPIAAYGGILALNEPVDDDAAERICDRECFFEVIVAPSFEPGALERLRARWTGVRLLSAGSMDLVHAAAPVEWRSIPGGVLAQERDHALTPAASFKHCAGPAPTQDQVRAASFLEAVGRCLFSNAVLLGGAAPETPGCLRMFGAGAGQMDRVTACRLAVEKSGKLARDSVAFSDAFFPFSDGPELLASAGVRAIVHPGGSKRDQETFDLCNARGVTCLTTGTRHFRH